MKAVFLDRDGVITQDPGFVNYESLEILPGVANAIKRLNEDYLVIVITNQPIVARGIMTEEEVEKTNKKMLQALEKQGTRIDAVYVCPHHPEKHHADIPPHAMKYRIDCNCRKPKTGMIDQACSDFSIDIEDSFLVGNSKTDIEAGKRAGCRTISIEKDLGADYKAESLLDASGIIKPDVSAIILAGGRGERLRPLTDSIPKPMIQISGKPVIQHQIEKLRSAGITDVIVCGSYLVEKIKEYFGSTWKGVELAYPDEPEQMGSGGAIRNAAGHIKHKRFVVINGDKMIGEFDFRKMIEFDLEKKSFATVLVRETDHPLDSDIIRLDDENRVIEFIGRGQDLYKTSNSGIIIGDARLIERIPDGKTNIEKDILFRLIDREEIFGFVLPKDWFVKDMGTPERLAAVRERFEVS